MRGVESPVTRRRFAQASAAAVASAALAGPEAFAQRRPDGPNVILLIVDSLRADAVYDGWVRTPNIDALARQGLRFTNAFPEAMPTVPARNSILSGLRRFPFRGWFDRPGLISAPGWMPLDHVDTSLPSVLSRAGWWTAYVTDNPFLGYSRNYEPVRRSVNRFVRTGGQIGGANKLASVPAHVLRHWLHPANESYKNRVRVGRYLANSRVWESPRNSYASRVFRNAIRELDTAATRRRPFALIVDTYEPHEPWTPPKRFLRPYDRGWRGPEPAMPSYGRAANWLGPSERGPVINRMRALYAAEVTMTDHWIGNLIDRLHHHDLERETVIVLVSDHGILLGEHGWTGKVQTGLYPALIRVPLMVIHPDRRRRGQASDWFASTHDIAPTILSMLGIRRPERMDGADLSRPFRGRKLPERDYAWGGYHDSFFIRSHRWMLFGYNQPSNLKLFDLRSDPGHRVNVASRNPGKRNELLAKVLARVDGRLPWYGGQ